MGVTDPKPEAAPMSPAQSQVSGMVRPLDAPTGIPTT